MSNRPRQTVPELVVPPLAEDPESVRIATLRRSLLAARDDRQRALDLLAIEAELARPSGGSARGPRSEMLRNRAAQLRTTAPKPAPEPAPAADGLPPQITRAIALLQGDAVAPPPDRAERIKRLREELAVIEPALGAVEAMLDDIRADRSRAVAEQLRPAQGQILRTIAEAATALSAAMDAERRFRAEFLMAGYSEQPDILPAPLLPGAARIGSRSEYDSEINRFIRFLTERGML
jgi:hypothetical protein